MFEIAGIFKKHGSSYLNKYSAGMLPSHTKAFDDILKCRTPIMGGKVYYCPDCKKYEYSYHSCGNRNCPKCQNDKADLWLEKNNNLLLPVNHFMVTFTLPGELRSFARSNQKLFYNLIFKCSSKSIEKLSADTKYIGGKPGMIGVLHTWSRTLVYHPHVHYIVTGVGLSEEKNKWNKSRSNFLFPVKALSVIFRAKFRDELRKLNPLLFNTIPHKIWKTDWVVNSIPVGNGDKALKYLAQYVFRIAISNNRIITLENRKVTFKYKESKTNPSVDGTIPSTDGWKIMRCIELAEMRCIELAEMRCIELAEMTLEVEEFIRRFLQHVLPSGFVKVRYYGLFASTNRGLLFKARELLDSKMKAKWEKHKSNKVKVFRCPGCKKEMTIAVIIPRPSRRFNKAPPIDNFFFSDAA